MGETLRILLVDDSPYDRGMVRRELKQEFDDVEVLDVTNESEFAASLESPTFDLVITDFQIRWTDGLKVFRAVKDRLPDCPVLMFTATGSEEIAVEAMKNGLDDYIIKNVQHMVRLRGAARAALDNSRTRVRARRLEFRLGDLLSHLRVGVFRRRLDGTVTEANDAAAAILGYSGADKLIGRRISDHVLHPPVPTESTPQAGNAGEETEVPAASTTGQQLWLSISEHLVTGDDGETLVDGLLEDVTTRREAEEQVRRIQDEMAHVGRLNVVAEIATGIAHELNQPLSAIANYSAVCAARLRNSDDPKIRELAETVDLINEMAHQSGGVIRELRGFTQRRVSHHESVVISELIDSAIAMLAFELRQNGVVVEWNPPQEESAVTVDAVQVRQVLVNLISNAIEAMTETDRSDRQVTITVGRSASAVCITVSDRGCGIADDHFEKMFEPFVSEKPAGTGIGLSISKRIVDTHGGTLSAKNNADCGATFEFTLPLDVRMTE